MSFVATNTIPLWEVWLIIVILILGSLLTFFRMWIGFISLTFGLIVLFPFLLNAEVNTGYVMDLSGDVITLIETYTELRLLSIIMVVVNVTALVIKGLSELME